MFNKKTDIGFQKGFTLLELSIVMVIIGLIIGGVLAGQDLIKSAEIRSQVSQLQQYDTVMNTFRSKYGGLPGDLEKGGDYFPTSSGGDGDGVFDDTDGLGSGEVSPDAYSGELDLVWEHIDLADMTDSSFASGGSPALAGTNFPETKFGTGGIVVASERNLNYYIVGAPTSLTVADINNAVGLSISPIEAFGIDSKLDDGIADDGKIRAINGIVAATGFGQADQDDDCLTVDSETYALGTNTGNISACTIAVRLGG